MKIIKKFVSEIRRCSIKEGYGKKSVVGCGLGFILIVVGKTFVIPILQIVGIVLWFFGCYMIVVGKGRNKAWTIIGIFSLIGLIVLLSLRRDESKVRQ